MGFKLPRLTTDIDCKPLGYPGLVVTCWLNPTYTEWEPPPKPEEWETDYYHGLARIIEVITIPAGYMDNGREVKIETKDAKTVYDLLRAEGFDQTIIVWAVEQYQRERDKRLQVAAKN